MRCHTNRTATTRHAQEGTAVDEMTGGEAVVETLKACGVEHIFGIPSIHNLPIYDAILRTGGVTPIGVRHEQTAVHAADGYARASGKLGVAIVSTGPGTTNGMTGLYEAGVASSRVLMITGQGESTAYGKGRGYTHEAENQMPMLRTVTRRAESVRRTEEIGEAIMRVVTDINTGRPQPGAVEIPIDFQHGRARVDIPHVEAWPRIQPQETQIAQAAEALRNAERPVIWAGGGIISSGAHAELTQLAELLNAPVVTTPNGRGSIPETHALAIGPFAGVPDVADVIASADVVLAVGTRFQPGPTRQWSLKINGTLIHLDADPKVIGQSYPAQIGIIGDARLGLAAILRQVRGGKGDPAFTARAQAARESARAAAFREIGPDHRAVMEAMREMMPRDAVLVRDTTLAGALWAGRVFPVIEPRTSIFPTSAGIGPGLPLAIGAAAGSGKRTVLIQGDGSFMLSIGELVTVVENNLPIIICVFNDRGYGVLRTFQSRAFEGRQIGVDLVTPKFADTARSMGMPGEDVSGVDGFKAAFARAMATNGPYLLDIDMDSLAQMGGNAELARRR